MTPEELYRIYRFDEPTRATQDAVRYPLSIHPSSMPTIEQVAIACNYGETPTVQHTPLNRAQRRRRR